jgi:hypothetical protein
MAGKAGADPARYQSRNQDQGKGCATEPGRFDDDDRTDDRRPENDRYRREAPGCAQDEQQRWLRVALRDLDSRYGNAASDGDERCFGTEDKSQPQRCERGQRDARHHVRLGASDLQAMCGNVTALAWQSRDRDGNRKARKCAHRERPP